MSFLTSLDSLPAPIIPDGATPDTSGNISVHVGPWQGFNDGDSVQILGGFGDQVLGSTKVVVRKSFFGGTAKVESVDIDVSGVTLGNLGNSGLTIKARWIHKDGEAFGSKVSAELEVPSPGMREAP
ncbi:hypothetical protein J2T07_003686 [Luteibacter jiangsuensis]|uniref:IPT/TIG domain-containing protein n=1 Tax=Luteibacter jiangsuensis TaxID=637577 RepID=A0ABT9T2G9_9GAMM|nr:hypothetical protein [Luteibacter jiangsuensis]MDQ0011476.1 hypothetical protein [Luteibacter jiangsuensis]